jgi:ParB-like chromosome segregation protein Spo0J
MMAAGSHAAAKSDLDDVQLLTRAQILKDSHFRARSGEVERAHVRTLVGAIRNSGKLDPVLVWRSPDADEIERYTLLDGAHRLAAYKAALWSGGIPARVVSCDRRAALLLAAGANAKDTLPLTTAEKWDMAWRLVMEPDAGFSKAEIAGTTGVSSRTVANMRLRLRVMKATGQEPSGNWRRDRTDAVWDNDEPPSDAQRKKEIEAMAKAVLAAVKGKQKHDEAWVADVLLAAFGYRLRLMADHLYGDVDEWGNTYIDEDHDEVEDDELTAF